MATISDPENNFDSRFPDQGFLVAHDLHDGSMFDYQSLSELAERLPQSSIEHNAADLEVNQDVSLVKKSKYTASDAIMNAETANTWVVLKNVEQDENYRQLMHDTLAAPLELAQRTLRDIDTFESFIFISSPNSVTPFHIDPEHNFLLQIKGQKTVFQWSRHDEKTLPPETLERHVYGGHHRNLEYNEEFLDRQTVYTMDPGQGLYFPVRAPHWVKNGPQTSVSFSVTFRSSQSERESRLYAHNGRKRANGKNPFPVNKNPVLDIAKDTLIRANRKISQLVS